jgi:prevent-host-death family protein
VRWINAAAEMVKRVEQKRNPIVIIQNGEAKAVLLDVESYRNPVDAVALMKMISIGENDFRNGNTVAQGKTGTIGKLGAKMKNS